ncbi:MAG: ABC transporter ATP-binding protein, partial [Candidatus Gracilibacteria bacterium]
MSDIAIKTENLSKSYKLYKNPIDRLKESLSPFRKKYHHDFFALKNINFEIKKGETIGIVGKNGSGKSTLLKIITKVLTPTEGHVTTKGKISALLELGAGFNPELSGTENIYFNGAIMGYTKEEIDKKLDNIIAFADIGEFIEQPVKTYSSGMFVRLAFAVATNVDPEILIIDEALSVGDMFFQAKCMEKMKKMINKGITLMFVSHDTGAIKSVCQKSILLDEGAIIDFD